VKSHQKSLRKGKFQSNYFPAEHAIPCAESGPKGFSPSYSPVLGLSVKLTKCFDGKSADFLLSSFVFSTNDSQVTIKINYRSWFKRSM